MFSMNYGYFRAAAASVELKVADTDFNAGKIISAVKEAAKSGASLVVLPELCVTGYTCGDLFFQKALLESAVRNLERIAEETASLEILIAAGLPVQKGGALYNAAAILFKGEVLAAVPKTFIPNYSEFYERRYFAPAKNLPENSFVFLSEKNPAVPFGSDFIFCEQRSGARIAFEICEDLWSVNPPSTRHALNGANIIANLSASNEIIGKADYRRLLLKSTSARLFSAYIYADAGHDESSQDLVFAGHNIIAENGKILAESALFKGGIIYADIDTELLENERARTSTFSESAALCNEEKPERRQGRHKEIIFSTGEKDYDKTAQFFRAVNKSPFVPDGKDARAERSNAVLQMQAEGLSKRLRHINAKSAVLGLSGGLDSTLALLVACRAFDLCSLDRKGILAVTMPGFGTTDRTYKNARTLAKEAGVSLKEVPIADAVLQHFKDIGHDKETHDVTYENSQARERTQILMDLANKSGGIVLGTGDLSELALGWCTYNGDQMSMYGVNASIPKTLVRHLVQYEADFCGNERLSRALSDILATPVSPELLPPTDGNISQKTEEIVGPYELHDFFLFNIIRFSYAPSKIFFLAKKAFGGIYEPGVIKSWLKIFYRRFFSQQFKRSCMPDGAKVGTVSLSPRGDWRMPSDASANIWIKEVEEL